MTCPRPKRQPGGTQNASTYRSASQTLGEQRAQLPRLLARGAESFGCCGAVWTAERVAQVIEREYDVVYHPSHVARLLHACGWSQQKPRCRATQRNEEAIRDWGETRLPALKKGPTRASINACL